MKPATEPILELDPGQCATAATAEDSDEVDT